MLIYGKSLKFHISELLGYSVNVLFSGFQQDPVNCESCGIRQSNIVLELLGKSPILKLHSTIIRHLPVIRPQKSIKMVVNGSNSHGHLPAVEYEENQDNGEPVQFKLDDKCTHYTSLKEVPWDLHKYWQQRYSMFSLYDYGIYMTDDAWFGVTLSQLLPKLPRTMHPIEKDPSVIACAENNAYIYGITNITWVNGDCFEYLKTHASSIDPSKTVVFASPPWGGPGYTTENIFDLSNMQPYSVQYIHEACKTMDTALYLPRTSDLRQITKLLPEGKKVELMLFESFVADQHRLLGLFMREKSLLHELKKNLHEKCNNFGESTLEQCKIYIMLNSL
ncbi:hypothetical protein DID88_004226 [Monilinia fructigena]|uniref:Trimethylguanosine synthase n=1 Tax=Monilinia fructigena TaxID=38457 RepID=A0A395ITG0_9HELO|nr:hypothetical protein DID88_004226 [Monilinia fructigena]